MNSTKNAMGPIIILMIVGLSLAVLTPPAQGFTHPCIPNTLEELDTIKASFDHEPWKQGYAVLAASGHSQLDYVMRGPFAEVKRNPNLNLNEWRSDMVAVYNLAKMWYFTGNEAYAQKARDILIAWANTHTSFGGQESGLDLGDFAPAYGGGASILRGTWPGWTAADTATVKNYFLNVLWPATAASVNIAGPANKGSLNLAAGIAIATFCDDTAKFDHVIDVFRTYPGTGLPNSLPTGEMGETGRDAGHGYADLKSRVFIAEVAWKQGIDLYSESDNRLLACGEYYARNTFTSDTPFVPYGTVDYHYYENADGPYTANRTAFYMLQNAYKNRLGLPTPWIDRKMEEQHVDDNNWMSAKTADFTTATSPAAIVRPAVSVASGGLTLTTLGTQTAGRSASYSNGVWTVSGMGNGTWTDGTDDCQFVYRAMTGDCAIVAQVTSATYTGSQNGKIGLMIRDNLVGTVSKRMWTAIVPTATGTNLVEAYANGWTVTWGGSNWAKRSQPLPPGLPYWIKIERRGDIITSYASQDGVSWSPTVSSDYATMPATVYIGLFICSGNATVNTATFANVAFTGGTGGLVTTPAAPAALFATGSSTEAITVRWLPSFGATAYDLLRSTTSGSGYTVIAGDLATDKTSYVDTTVSAGTTYYYVARAKNYVGTSGNSPEFYAALLDPPRVNIAYGGTSSASFQSGAGIEGSDQAFNRDPGSKWYGWNAPIGWLQYDFGVGNAQVVERYTINCADVLERDPKDWNFLGSQDGSNWTILDSQINQSFVIRMGMNTYDIGNTTAYRFYRLDITANNGAGGVAVSELGLWLTPNGPLPNLAAHYQFEDNTVDGSGNWLNATAAGGPAYTAGRIGQAVILDGVDDVITAPASVANSEDITIAAWIYWNGGGNRQHVFDFGNGTSQSLFLSPSDGSAMRFAIKNDGSEQIVETSTLATGQWVHVAVTIGGDTGTLYVNGEPVASNAAMTINPSDFGPSVNYIGGSQDAADPLFNGAIDDFRIYNYALSGIEVADLAADVPNLVAWYELEGNVNDSSGYGYNGTATGSPAYTTGYIGQAIDLDGANDFVTLPADAANSDDITVAAWVNWDGGGNWQRIFDFGNNTTQYMFLSPASGSGTLRFAITTSGGGGEQIVETSTLATGQWVHVAVTLGGNLATLYVDGVPVSTNAVTSNPSDFLPTNNYIGKSQYADPLFNGRVDGFRVYDHALSAAQIAGLASNTAPPSFTVKPIDNLLAIEGTAYLGDSLTIYADDPDGLETVTFSKEAGANWLSIALNGTLSGIPGDSDVGENTFTVCVTDDGGLSDTAQMTIQVLNTYSGTQGLNDLQGLASQWLMQNCSDVPACGGGDLDGDYDVDLSDLAELENNWQTGL